MRIFITGHRGFVGRHFVRYFEGHDIVGCDLKEGEDARDWFHDPNFYEVFDLVIHCAAIVEGRGAIEGEPLKVATNLALDSEFFNWAVRTKQKKLICFSSSAAYPVAVQNAEENIISQEDMVSLEVIRIPDQTYGFSKLALEVLAEVAKKTYPEMEVYVFRPFSGYGSDQDLDYPFPAFIQRFKEQANPIECWGNGEQVRDWIHIDDIVEGVMAAVEAKISYPVNLCSGKGYSMNDTLKLMMEVSGHEAPIKHLLDKPVGVRYRVGDPTKMLSFYQPKVSLEEGIRRALYE